eukprot:9039385-Pyramimonas_sp.AAC.1
MRGWTRWRSCAPTRGPVGPSAWRAGRGRQSWSGVGGGRAISLRWRFSARWLLYVGDSVFATIRDSSSHVLNAVVKGISALVRAASARPIYGHAETDNNPADDPSRGGGIPVSNHAAAEALEV